MTAHVLVLVDQRYRAQLQPRGMVKSLRKRGARVTLLDEHDLHTPVWDDALRRCDLLVARGRNVRVLAALAQARRLGVPVLDDADAIELVRDKRLMTQLFTAAGVPTPRTAVGSPADVAASDLVPPLICKPIFGDNSAGLVIVDSHSELAALTWPEPEMIVQEYRPGDGVDLKLYVINGEVTAVRKPSPISECTADDLGFVALDDQMVALAQQCQDLFGLTFFGVDLLQTADGYVVLEVNDFPNYTAVPFASRRLARHVLANATSVRAVAS